jgi:hypothetical protein
MGRRIGLLLGTALTMSVALAAIEAQARPDKGHSSSAQDRSGRANTTHDGQDQANDRGSKGHRNRDSTNHRHEPTKARSHERRDSRSYGKARNQHSGHNGRASPAEVSNESEARHSKNQQSRSEYMQHFHRDQYSNPEDHGLGRSNAGSHSSQTAHSQLSEESLAHPTENAKLTASPSHRDSKITQALRQIDANQKLRSEL